MHLEVEALIYIKHFRVGQYLNFPEEETKYTSINNRVSVNLI